MSKTLSYREWTSDELNYLHDNYDSMTATAIAEALERTPDSVWERADREGLRKHAKRHSRTPDGPWYCPSCGKTKPKEEFSINSKTQKATAYCKECSARKVRERRQAKKK